MKRQKAMAEKLADVLTYGLSLSLAAGVLVFAAYKVVALNGMENPPANMGLNFPPLKPKVIMQGPSLAADEITTQSLAPDRPPAGLRVMAGATPDYQLLTVLDGVAFVAVNGSAGKTLIPVTVGSSLPGGVTVSAIRQQAGRWQLVAGKLTLEQSPMLPSPPAQ